MATKLRKTVQTTLAGYLASHGFVKRESDDAFANRHINFQGPNFWLRLFEDRGFIETSVAADSEPIEWLSLPNVVAFLTDSPVRADTGDVAIDELQSHHSRLVEFLGSDAAPARQDFRRWQDELGKRTIEQMHQRDAEAAAARKARPWWKFWA